MKTQQSKNNTQTIKKNPKTNQEKMAKIFMTKMLIDWKTLETSDIQRKQIYLVNIKKKNKRRKSFKKFMKTKRLKKIVD